MAWENRGNGRYYYRKVRANGRVTSEYVGAGDTAAWVAHFDQLQQESHRWETLKAHDERANERAIEQEFEQVSRAIRAVTAAVLIAGGYYRHKGQWRKTGAIMAAHLTMRLETEVSNLFEAVDKKKPTPADIRQLRKMLRERPDLWRALGDMAHNAASHLIDTLEAPESLKLSLQQGWQSLQVELGAAGATSLEQLLIQQVVIAWLRLGIVEYKYTSVTNEAITLTMGDFWERRLSAAQRRFLRACETLARIRKLNLPAIQVNIAADGGQQVNQVNLV